MTYKQRAIKHQIEADKLAGAARCCVYSASIGFSQPFILRQASDARKLLRQWLLLRRVITCLRYYDSATRY